MAATFGSNNQQANNQSNTAQHGTAQAAPSSGGYSTAFGLNPLISRTGAVDNVNEMLEKWNKVLAAKNIGIKLTTMTEVRRACTFTIILATMSGQRANGRGVVAVHTLIVEPQELVAADHVFTVGNQTVEIPAVAGNIFNNDLFKRVERRVIELYGDVDVVDAYTSVIPREMPYQNEQHTTLALVYAVEAVYRTLIESIGASYDYFNVANADCIPKNYRMQSRIIVNSQDAISPVGLPIRSDLQVVVSGSENANQNDPFGLGGNEFTAVDGYINLLYQRPAAAGYGMPPVTQHYYPQYVITNIESRFGPCTLELFLFALHSVSNVGKNWAWVAQFLPRLNGNNPLKSLDALGIEVPQLTGDVTKPKLLNTMAMSTDEIYRLVTTAVHGAMAISMDVEETGSTSFLSTRLLAAAAGIPEAIHHVIRAADNLTNQNFSKIFKGGQIICDDQTRIHLGYFHNENRERIDIRHLDYLAVANHTAGDELSSKVREWEDTFYNYTIDADVRLHRRTRLIKEMLVEPRFKGYARRITFTADFINALNSAIIAAGCNIVPSNTAFEFNNNQRHTFQNMAQFAIDPRNLAGMFNYGGGGATNPMANNGRWAQR